MGISPGISPGGNPRGYPLRIPVIAPETATTEPNLSTDWTGGVSSKNDGCKCLQRDQTANSCRHVDFKVQRRAAGTHVILHHKRREEARPSQQPASIDE
uniref:SWIM-type domain-containing protein n=1 Tax=Panagrellus redivivus TaxID=6233 RepID=A0A7E4UXE4_PANRE